jgi:hypothetical protein
MTAEERVETALRSAEPVRALRALVQDLARDVRQLYRMIDWLMELPPPLQQVFQRQVDEYEEGQPMPFYDMWQRRAMLQMLEESLRAKFGEEGAELIPTLRELNDAEKYIALSGSIATATSLAEVRQACAEAAAPATRRKKGGNGKRGSSKK